MVVPCARARARALELVRVSWRARVSLAAARVVRARRAPPVRRARRAHRAPHLRLLLQPDLYTHEYTHHY